MRAAILLLPLLLGCPSGEPDDSSADTGEPGDSAAPDDTGEPWVPPAGWPDPWGVLSLGLGCLELEGTGLSSEAERASAVASEVVGRDIAVLALQDVCAGDGEDALELLEAALEEASGVDWAAGRQVTGSGGGVERSVAILAREELGEPWAMPFVQQGAEDRWVLAADIAAGVRVVTTQLEDADADVREVQARAMVAAVLGSAPSLDLLLAADFADENRSSAVWAQTGAGFVEDSGDQDDGRRHLLHHRSAALASTGSATLFDGSEGPVVAEHPGVAAWYTTGAADDSCITEIVVDVATGSTEWVALRGTAFPLDWSFGQPAWERSAGEWVWTTTEIPDGAFEWKALLNDETWQVGEDIEGAGCGVNSTTPTWEEPDDAVDPRDRR